MRWYKKWINGEWQVVVLVIEVHSLLYNVKFYNVHYNVHCKYCRLAARLCKPTPSLLNKL
jgi:hypothetical protein